MKEPNFSRRPDRIEEIIRDVCRSSAVTRSALLGGSRMLSVANARGEICRRLRGLGLSLPQIGKELNLHHTSVLHHCGPLPPAEPTEPEEWAPDESGVWAI